MKTKEELKKLIDDHWKYLSGVLEISGVESNVRKEIEFHYKTAFEHGYKHCQEDKQLPN